MDALLAIGLLPLFLLPCAIQDWRSHQISNWLTIPAFLTAWVAAVVLGNVILTMAIFIGCYLAWSRRWMGAADGKLFTLVAAVAPPVLAISALLLGLTFLLLRLMRRQETYLPAAVWLWLASVLNAIIMSPQIAQTEPIFTWWLIGLPQLLGMSFGLFNLAFLFSQMNKSTILFLPKQ